MPSEYGSSPVLQPADQMRSGSPRPRSCISRGIASRSSASKASGSRKNCVTPMRRSAKSARASFSAAASPPRSRADVRVWIVNPQNVHPPFDTSQDRARLVPAEVVPDDIAHHVRHRPQNAVDRIVPHPASFRDRPTRRDAARPIFFVGIVRLLLRREPRDQPQPAEPTGVVEDPPAQFPGRQDVIEHARVRRRVGHRAELGRRPFLPERQAAAFFDRAQPERPVAAEPAEHDADGTLAQVICQRVEEAVDRRRRARAAWPVSHRPSPSGATGRRHRLRRPAPASAATPPAAGSRRAFPARRPHHLPRAHTATACAGPAIPASASRDPDANAARRRRQPPVPAPPSPGRQVPLEIAKVLPTRRPTLLAHIPLAAMVAACLLLKQSPHRSPRQRLNHPPFS